MVPRTVAISLSATSTAEPVAAAVLLVTVVRLPNRTRGVAVSVLVLSWSLQHVAEPVEQTVRRRVESMRRFGTVEVFAARVGSQPAERVACSVQQRVALTLQTAIGFLLTNATIRLLPVWQAKWGWEWAFAPLAIGPALGTIAMLRLRHRPEAVRLAGGRR